MVNYWLDKRPPTAVRPANGDPTVQSVADQHFAEESVYCASVQGSA